MGGDPYDGAKTWIDGPNIGPAPGEKKPKKKPEPGKGTQVTPGQAASQPVEPGKSTKTENLPPRPPVAPPPAPKPPEPPPLSASAQSVMSTSHGGPPGPPLTDLEKQYYGPDAAAVAKMTIGERNAYNTERFVREMFTPEQLKEVEKMPIGQQVPYLLAKMERDQLLDWLEPKDRETLDAAPLEQQPKLIEKFATEHARKWAEDEKKKKEKREKEKEEKQKEKETEQTEGEDGGDKKPPAKKSPRDHASGLPSGKRQH